MSPQRGWRARIRHAVELVPRSRLPIIIELSGMPRLGKTTFSDSLVDLIRRAGCKVRLFAKATSESPIEDRWSLEFTAWTLAVFIKDYLEAQQSGAQVLVADRGLFDAVVWLRLKLAKGICQQSTFEVLRELALASPWRDSISVALVFMGDPDNVLRRAFERRLYDGESLVTTKENLLLFQDVIREEAKIWNADREVIKPLVITAECLSEVLNGVAEKAVRSLEAFAREV